MIRWGFCKMLLKFAQFLWHSEHKVIERDHEKSGEVNLARYGLKIAHYAGLRFTDFIRNNDKKHGDHYLYDFYFGTLAAGIRRLMPFKSHTVEATYYMASHGMFCGFGEAPT